MNPRKKKRVLITGSTGIVGSSLIKSISNEYKIFGISVSEGFNIVDYNSLISINGNFDIIIHCAASFGNNTIDSMIQNEYVNSVGSLNVCKLAAEKKCKHIVYTSSISSLYTDGMLNSYGLSKKHGEDNIKLFCDHNNIGYSILRFSQIYDDECRAAKHQKFLYYLIDTIQQGKTVQIYGKNNPLRNFIHIDDVVEVIKRIITEAVFGEYSCIYPKSYSIYEIIAMIGKAFGKKPQKKVLRNKDDILDISIPSDTSIYEKINFYPNIDLTDELKE